MSRPPDDPDDFTPEERLDYLRRSVVQLMAVSKNVEQDDRVTASDKVRQELGTVTSLVDC